jgi:hypothetical protein
LQPLTQYELTVNLRATGVAVIDGSTGFRDHAGSTIVASTEHAWTLTLPAMEYLAPEPPTVLPIQPELDALLISNVLNDGTMEYGLQFTTSENPPSGLVSVELYAESIGVLSEAVFDNLRLTMTADDPVVLTSIARQGLASYRVAATIRPADGQVVAWSDE